MQISSRAVCVTLLVLILFMTACAGIPISLPLSANPAAPSARVLTRCQPVAVEICLVSFGIQEPDRMLVILSVPAGLPDDFLARVTYKDRSTIFPCVAASDSDATVYCTGSQVPLGSTITVGVLASKGRAVIYQGEFVVNAFALATVAVNPPTATVDPAAVATKRARTPTPRAGYPNP